MVGTLLEGVLGPGLGLTRALLVLEGVRCLPASIFERELDGHSFAIDRALDMRTGLNSRVLKVRS